MTRPTAVVSRGFGFALFGVMFIALGAVALIWYMLPWSLLVSFVNSGASSIWADIGSPRAFGIGFLGVLTYYAVSLAALFFAWRLVASVRERWAN